MEQLLNKIENARSETGETFYKERLFGVLSILNESANHFLSLLTEYKNNVLKSIKGSKTYINKSTSSFNMLITIRSILYSSLVDRFVPYTSIFVIRSYIENKIRKTFTTNYKSTKDIELSKILNLLSQNEEKFCRIEGGKKIFEHCCTFLKIVEWANSFVHTQNKPRIWTQYLILDYFHIVEDDSESIYCSNNIQYNIVDSPLLPHELDCLKELFDLSNRSRCDTHLKKETHHGETNIDTKKN